GRGLVEPVDDLRDTNPASNGPLLGLLADTLRNSNYDLKALIRFIATSHVYGLEVEASDRNRLDTRNYSRHYRRRLRAESLLDAISSITGVADRFAASPPKSRAMDLWTLRSPSLFLDTFGRPDLNQDPPCERVADTSVVQALHLLNAPTLQRKLTSKTGRVTELEKSALGPAEICTELYLATYSRFPRPEEVESAMQRFAKTANRRHAIEDLLWALLNTPEFVFR
ncbi:MAG: DUF1553 domain-containing protein, partial [Planctomycetota bacterium]